METIFSYERSKDHYALEMDVVAEVLAAILGETGLPNCGVITITAKKSDEMHQLFRAQIGSNEEDPQSTDFAENVRIYAGMCDESIARAANRRTVEGIQTGIANKSIFIKIDNVKVYAAYFATYAENTTQEVDRILLALVEIGRKLYPEDRRLEAVVDGVKKQFLENNPEYQETIELIQEAFLAPIPDGAIETWLRA